MLVKWIIIGYIVNAIIILSALICGINITSEVTLNDAKEASEKFDSVLWFGYVLTCLFYAFIVTVIFAIIWPWSIIAFVRDVILKKGIR